MALLFSDSFDHFTDLTLKWDVVTAEFTSIAGGGRRGTNCIQYFGGGRCRKSYSAATGPTLIAAFAAKRVSSASAGPRNICRFLDNTTGHIALIWRDDNFFEFYRGGDESANDIGTKIAGPSTASVTANAYHYIELKVLLNATTGTADLKVDGVNILSFSGNTLGTANLTATQFQFGSTGSPGGVAQGPWQIYFDDLLLMDGTGTYNKDFIGDKAVGINFPTADGTYAQWALSTGAQGFALVDENPPNTTDYISTGTTSSLTSFTYPAIAAGSAQSIYAVVCNVYSSLSGGGPHVLAGLAKSGVSVGTSASTWAVPGSFHINQGIFETDPATGVPWTVAGVDAAEFGVKLVS
jgi:hypothetical protein